MILERSLRAPPHKVLPQRLDGSIASARAARQPAKTDARADPRTSCAFDFPVLRDGNGVSPTGAEAQQLRTSRAWSGATW